jgi:hypothetical protein
MILGILPERESSDDINKFSSSKLQNENEQDIGSGFSKL